MNKKGIFRKALWIFAFIMFLLAVIVFCFTCQMVDTGTALDSLIFTINAGLDGTNPNTVIDGALPYLPRAAGLILLALFLNGICHKCLRRVDIFLTINKKRLRMTGAITAFVLVFELVIVPVASFIYLDAKLLVLRYLSNETTQLYEEYYVPVNEVTITAPEQPKNLVFIWLESMEDTYSDSAHHGAQSENLIPGLTVLAEQNAGFYGMHAAPYAQYTFGAMFAAACGTPNAFSLRKNTNLPEAPAQSVDFLWDILSNNGYVSEYLCGSDSNFAGTKEMLTRHGFDKVYDLQTARDNGVVPQDYYENWGIEDYRVYEIAKQEITQLSETGKPFSFMLSTMDTHYPRGYECIYCSDEYGSVTANVIACADRQVTEFVEWLKQQPYWENTVVIICGDHPRMDTCLVEGVSYFDRTLYNCFINSAKQTDKRERVFTQLDLFPTTLSALGFEIDGGRIGFGTDLFSGRQTLPEELGYDYFEAEIQKRSDFFLNYMQ